MSESEVTVSLTPTEAQALLPHNGKHMTTQDWNRRVALVEDAHIKIRAALRDQSPEPIQGQENLLDV